MDFDWLIDFDFVSSSHDIDLRLIAYLFCVKLHVFIYFTLQ